MTDDLAVLPRLSSNHQKICNEPYKSQDHRKAERLKRRPTTLEVVYSCNMQKAMKLTYTKGGAISGETSSDMLN